LLSPRDFGVMGMALAILGVAQLFAQLGVGPSLVQRPQLEDRHITTAWSFSILFSFLFGVLLYICAAPLAHFFSTPALKSTLRALLIIFPLAGISVVPESLLQRNLQFRALARIEILSYGIGFAGVATISAWFGLGIWSLVLGQLFWMLSRSIQLLHATTLPRIGFERAAFSDLWRFGSGETVGALANYAAFNADNLVVGKVLGAQATGIYMRAWQLTQMILIGAIFEKVLFPTFSKVQAQKERLRRAYCNGTQAIASIVLPVIAIAISLAPYAIPLLLGSKWGDVTLPLQLFLLTLLWKVEIKLNNSVIRAAGAINSFAIGQVILVITTVLCAWLGTRWGIPGVCIGVSFPLFGYYLFSTFLALRLSNLSVRDFILIHVPGALLCSATVAVSLLCNTLLSHSHIPTIGLLLINGTVPTLFVISMFLSFPKILMGEYGKHFVLRELLNRADKLRHRFKQQVSSVET
jgi:O-antigen/teichoic acid export membrane protein